MSLPHPSTPQLFYGHKTLEKKLFERYGEGKLPHALLFKGEAGIGKSTLAYRFARHILQMGPEEDLLAHPDFFRLERDPESKSGQITLDQAQGLRVFFQKSRARSKTKIALVDDAHLLNRSAFNSLLKVLEEPPEGALLIFIASKPLPETIVSRCTHIAFKPLEDKVIMALLENFECDLDNINMKVVSAFAKGSFTKAYYFINEGGPHVYGRLRDMFSQKKEARALAASSLLDTLGDMTPETFNFWAELILFAYSEYALEEGFSEMETAELYAELEAFFKASLELNLDLKLSLLNAMLGKRKLCSSIVTAI